LTLEEALELIDTCDTVPSLDVTGTDAGDPSTGSDDAPTKPKKRVRNPQNDVKRRQRRKAERQQLKDQVQQYEALVELLKRDGRRKLGCVNGGGCVGSTALTARGAGASWLQNVVEEEQKLRKAEEVNAKLKSLLVGRLQAAGTIRDVLAKEKMLLAVRLWGDCFLQWKLWRTDLLLAVSTEKEFYCRASRSSACSVELRGGQSHFSAAKDESWQHLELHRRRVRLVCLG